MSTHLGDLLIARDSRTGLAFRVVNVPDACRAAMRELIASTGLKRNAFAAEVGIKPPTLGNFLNSKRAGMKLATVEDVRVALSRLLHREIAAHELFTPDALTRSGVERVRSGSADRLAQHTPVPGEGDQVIENDPVLAMLVKTWPNLTEDVRWQIVQLAAGAMVKASGTDTTPAVDEAPPEEKIQG